MPLPLDFRTFPILASIGSIAILALASCGVVAHGSGAGADGGGGVSSAMLGERAVPGFTISAQRWSEFQPGHPCTIRVTVVADAGQSAAASLEAWLGTAAYDPTATPIAATPVPGLAGTYDVTVVLPASVRADAVVWIRLRTVDGAVIEAGRDAFPIHA